MKMIYNVKDKPKFGQLIVFAFQQLLAIMAATIAVPMIVGNGMSTSAALFGAGVGTLVYVAFTKGKSPVFLGSSFAFLGSMAAAFAGAASVALGFLGLIIGAALAGLVSDHGDVGVLHAPSVLGDLQIPFPSVSVLHGPFRSAKEDLVQFLVSDVGETL